MKRRIAFVTLLVLVVLALIGYSAYQRRAAAVASASAAPAPPTTILVTRGEVVLTVTAPGRLVGLRETVLSLPAVSYTHLTLPTSDLV